MRGEERSCECEDEVERGKVSLRSVSEKEAVKKTKSPTFAYDGCVFGG